MGDLRRGAADAGAGRPERRAAELGPVGVRLRRASRRPRRTSARVRLLRARARPVQRGHDRHRRRTGVSWDGEGADELPLDGTDLVSRALSAAVERQQRSHSGISIPPVRIEGLNRIPLQAGLGSSSAAAVAGTALADALLGEEGWHADPSTTFAYAADLEGHPDNAAPATYGALTVVADGGVRRLDVSAAIARRPCCPADPALHRSGPRGSPEAGPARGRGLQRRPRRPRRPGVGDGRSRPPACGASGSVCTRPRGWPWFLRCVWCSRSSIDPSFRCAYPVRARACSRSRPTGRTSQTRVTAGAWSVSPCGRSASRSSRHDDDAAPARMSGPVSEPGTDVEPGGTVAETGPAQEETAQPVLRHRPRQQDARRQGRPRPSCTRMSRGTFDRGGDFGLGLYSQGHPVPLALRPADLRARPDAALVLGRARLLSLRRPHEPRPVRRDRLIAPQHTLNLRRIRTIKGSLFERDPDQELQSVPMSISRWSYASRPTSRTSSRSAA